MKIPPGMTEEEVLVVIEKISNRLAYKYRFAYHQIEDLKQEAAIEAIKGLEKFDPSMGKPLENFLFIHVRNRLHNFKRDNYERKECPCHTCPLGAWIPATDGCKKYDDKMECGWFGGWITRNTAKKNVLMPINLGSVKGDKESNMWQEYDITDVLDANMLENKLEDKLPLSYRKDYIKLKNGIKISKSKQEALIDMIIEVLYEEEKH